MIRDPLGRTISYLRLSVTDRCDLRCVYCMDEDTAFLPKAEVLTLEELERVAAAFVRLGTRRIRLTGGEPLRRRNVVSLVGRLGAMIGPGALEEVTLTTNGTRLARLAPELAAAGIRRVNVSLDSLDPGRFAAITRQGRLEAVVEGVLAAKAAGLAVKINTVALRGVNDDEFDRLLEWCGGHGFDLTLIETMPVGEVGGGRDSRYLPLSLVRAGLERRWTLADDDGPRAGGPARTARVAETGRRIGFITPMSHNFCESCNRVRVSCTGTLYPCLGRDVAVDLRGPLRSGESDRALEAAIVAGVAVKPKGHDFLTHFDMRPAVIRPMRTTGG